MHDIEPRKPAESSNENRPSKRRNDELPNERQVLRFMSWMSAGVAAAYVGYFWGHLGATIGGPVEWGQFGDFVGGVLSPILGIGTAVLVIHTLRATREEANDTRQEMRLQTDHLESQVRHFERAQELDEMKKKLDGVLADWNAALDLPAGELPFFKTDRESVMRDTNRSVRELLVDAQLPGQFAGYESHPHRHGVMVKWNDRFEPMLMLLDEFERYCAEYDAEAGGKQLTDYYRRRVQLPLRAFRAVGIVSPTELTGLNTGIKQRAYAS